MEASTSRMHRNSDILVALYSCKPASYTTVDAHRARMIRTGVYKSKGCFTGIRKQTQENLVDVEQFGQFLGLDPSCFRQVFKNPHLNRDPDCGMDVELVDMSVTCNLSPRDKKRTHTPEIMLNKVTFGSSAARTKSCAALITRSRCFDSFDPSLASRSLYAKAAATTSAHRTSTSSP